MWRTANNIAGLLDFALIIVAVIGIGMAISRAVVKERSGPRVGERVTYVAAGTGAAEAERHVYVIRTDPFKHHNDTSLCASCEKPFENWRHTYAGLPS